MHKGHRGDRRQMLRNHGPKSRSAAGSKCPGTDQKDNSGTGPKGLRLGSTESTPMAVRKTCVAAISRRRQRGSAGNREVGERARRRKGKDRRQAKRTWTFLRAGELNTTGSLGSTLAIGVLRAYSSKDFSTPCRRLCPGGTLTTSLGHMYESEVRKGGKLHGACPLRPSDVRSAVASAFV